MAPGPLQQLPAAADGQYAAERELVRWRDVGQPHARGVGQLFGVEAVLVHVDRQQARAGGREAVSRHQVTGVLEDEVVAGIQQQPRAQVDGLLRTLHDEDLSGFTGYPARAPQVALQRAAQRRLALGRGVAQAVRRALQGMLIGALPGQAGKVARGQRAVEEVVTHRRMRQRRRRADICHAPAPGGQGERAAGRRAGGRRVGVGRGQGAGEAGGAARGGIQESFGRELFVDGGDRGARDAEPGGQGAGRWQRRAGGQRAVGDLAAQQVVDASARPVGTAGAAGGLA
ncbi:Uncharacterised protein [Bordetella pertussis]|nr:Uncharacterised protein [Bordetella pertussis]CFP31587.1 Uncharacterised protein [Bordetella pertussis]